MSLTNVPTIPQQPSQAEYPATDLQTLQTFTYESYSAAAGVPPPWDATRPEQYWFDSSASAAPGSVYAYSAVVIDANGDPIVGPQMIPALWALTPNIPPPQVTDAPGTAILPVPVRALLANEQLFINPDAAGPGIGGPWVLNTSLQGTLAATYTQGDKAILARLGAYLSKQGA